MRVRFVWDMHRIAMASCLARAHPIVHTQGRFKRWPHDGTASQQRSPIPGAPPASVCSASRSLGIAGGAGVAGSVVGRRRRTIETDALSDTVLVQPVSCGLRIDPHCSERAMFANREDAHPSKLAGCLADIAACCCHATEDGKSTVRGKGGRSRFATSPVHTGGQARRTGGPDRGLSR